MKATFFSWLCSGLVFSLFSLPTHAQSFVDNFLSDFDDGDPVAWFAFRTENGTVSVSDGVANFDSTTGSSSSFGIALDIPHADVVSEMTAQFINGDANTFLLNNLRDFRNATTHQGQYYMAISQTGELGIGYLETNGASFVPVRGEFLPTGPLGPNDIVRMRTEVSGSTITHSAWLEGTDPASGASVMWTDPLDRYPIGDLVAISFVANGNVDAEVNVHSYSLTIVPEPAGVWLLLSSLLALPLLSRRMRYGRRA